MIDEMASNGHTDGGSMKKRIRNRLYVGYTKEAHSGITKKLFRSPPTPNEITHGHLFYACIGPFRTLAGAQFCVDYIGMVYQTVAEFEKAARHKTARHQ